MWSCQSFVLLSDPPAGDFHQHGNQACECLSERFNQSRSERRETAAGSVAAGHELNFDR